MEAKLVEVMGELQKLAGVVGVEAIRLWPQVVGITFVKSVFFVAVALLVMIAAFISAILLNKRIEVDFSGYNGGDRLFMKCMVWMVAIVVIFISLATLPDNLSGIFFPEAKTILDLAASLKK